MGEPEQPDAAMERLAHALEAEESAHDPALLALLMAAAFYPELDIGQYTRRLDAMAERALARLPKERTPARVLNAINHVLYEEEAFAGNVENYYDPRNSFLNEVLDRRLGIPISLSVVYLAIARRLEAPIVGVGLPFHFVVKYVAETDIYVDPFHRGKIRTVSECRALVNEAYGAPVTLREGSFDAVGARVILYRMLSNLKYIFLRRRDTRHAGRAIDLMLLVRPDQAQEMRDRGLLYLEEKRWAQAARYLSRYLKTEPDTPDAEVVRDKLCKAFELRARRN